MSDIWKIRGDGFDSTIEYADLAVIKPLIDAQVEQKIAVESAHFHVYAQYLHEDGGYISLPCDLELDTAPHAAHYVTSNMFTGSYEQFDNFLDAKQRCLEIKQIRRNQYACTYHVVQNTGLDGNGVPDGSEVIVYTGVTL
jgi:hypothetical protein